MSKSKVWTFYQTGRRKEIMDHCTKKSQVYATELLDAMLGITMHVIHQWEEERSDEIVMYGGKEAKISTLDDAAVAFIVKTPESGPLYRRVAALEYFSRYGFRVPWKYRRNDIFADMREALLHVLLPVTEDIEVAWRTLAPR